MKQTKLSRALDMQAYSRSIRAAVLEQRSFDFVRRDLGLTERKIARHKSSLKSTGSQIAKLV